jgi:hypothetical protein
LKLKQDAFELWVEWIQTCTQPPPPPHLGNPVPVGAFGGGDRRASQRRALHVHPHPGGLGSQRRVPALFVVVVEVFPPKRQSLGEEPEA